MLKPKKRDNYLARRQQYLNYGALTLATLLEERGYSVKLFHGGHEHPISFVDMLNQFGVFYSKYPLMISMQSLYALEWTQEFTKLVKNIYPTKTIILGGRWAIGSDPLWIKQRLPFVDRVEGGLGEDKILNLAESNNHKRISINSNQVLPPEVLNHQIVDKYELFQPNIEVSRGCGMGCDFCEERSIPLTKLKPAIHVADQLQKVALQYNDFSIRPYLQSSFFAPNKKWSENLASAVAKHEKIIQWRCESRVDALKPESIKYLALGGMKAIDLGLESASPQQIINMKKSNDPDKYLRSASELLKACRDNNVYVKLNYLLYAGETEKTIDETIAWLDEHADCIKGISVGPVVVFGAPTASKDFVENLEKLGASLVSQEELYQKGIGHIHPSAKISSDDAEEISIKISKKYMVMDDYFYLKSFSYYPRNYNFDDFKKDVMCSDKEKLPFYI
ncbi:radical SAM protein [Marinomonas ostreistagni]|uniref:Radical SAM protein n=2 Tax=Marinomonas ostreistagni TaxID=359209 RepID=A0ABS0ZG69_9GAMM|nr:radical SAM protein [Marinomonas ostreistagni]